MRKHIFVLVVISALFLLPVVNPSLSSYAPAIGNESYLSQESPIITVNTSLLLFHQEDLTGRINITGQHNFDAPVPSNYTSLGAHTVNITVTGENAWLTVYLLNTWTRQKEYLIHGQTNNASLTIDTRVLQETWFWLHISAVDGESTRSRHARLFYPARVVFRGPINDRYYFPAADGDESGESITSFSETTSNNQMYFLGSDGWQHDCSTTANVSSVGSGKVTISSDGDVIEIKNNFDDQPHAASFWINSSSQESIETDDFPFLSVNITAIETGGEWSLSLYDNTTLTSIYGPTTETGVFRFNIKEGYTSDPNQVYIYAGGIYTHINKWVNVSWVKIYSITDFTYTCSGAGSNDTLHVDSDILYSTIDSGYIELNHDPALAVNTATYNVWNVTTQTTAPQSAYYVAGWSSYHSETRGSLSSGTLTDLKLNFSTAHTVSAVRFIEDATAPTIHELWVNPPQPDDAEATTFTAYTSDAVDVYSVVLNAVVYPAGFSDIDYSMIEETEDQLWYYTFSTMIKGYYLFAITASDGINTDVEFLPVSVIEAGISLRPISLIGAGPDFTGIQFSFDCNRAGTFSITEWTQVNETYATDEAETHTGTVIDGYNNVFWDKLDTTVLTVYFNFTIDSGSLQANWTSTYQVAAVTFDVVLSDKFTDFDRVFIEGEASKAATYQVYDASNILRYTGSVPEGSFALNFEMWNKRSLSDHFYGIKFTNGSSIDWINGSYYADSPDQYKGGGVDTGPVAWWQDPMTWVLIGGGLAGVYIITSGQKTGNIPNVPKRVK